MGLYNGEYYLSNSEMSAWETLCPRVWKARYIDLLPELWEDSEEITVMDWGVEFETLAIGSGVGGRMVPDDKRAKMKKSEYYTRIKQQAEECRRFFKLMGGKIIARQPYLYSSIKDSDGQDIYICGGLDLLMGFEGGRNNLIIDTKLTGDNDNDFGKYQFGNVDKVNPTQAIHYMLLHKAHYGTDADFNYFVFDKSPSLKRKIINVTVSEISLLLHIDKCSRIYNEIMMAINLNDWNYTNTYDNCRDCPVKCLYERVMPDILELNA